MQYKNKTKDIITESREWLGTKWRHGQSTKGVSADCVGFVTGVFRNLGYEVFYENYHQKPIGNELYLEFKKRLIEKPVSEKNIGDVVLFKIFKRTVHTGILSDFKDKKFWYIHSDDRPGIGKVVETPLTLNWGRRIAYCFYVPNSDL